MEALTSYSFSMANTFVNTQGSTQKITKTEYDRGIVAGDFESGEARPSCAKFGPVHGCRELPSKLPFQVWDVHLFEVSLEVPFLT